MFRALELRVPPGLVFVICAAAMGGLSRLVPVSVALPGKGIVSGGIAGVALLIAGWGVLDFLRARTTVNPIAPDRARTLVVRGIYRFTRNPMYLGLALLLVAWAYVLGSLLAFLGVPAFIAYLNRFQITPEECILAEKFGPAYEAYRGRVRRW